MVIVMNEKQFRCLEENCGGPLAEMVVSSTSRDYDTIEYECQRCSKKFFRKHYPNADFSHIEQQNLIKRVRQI